MKIKNRLADVDELITIIIQEYLNFIVYDDWKIILIDYMKKVITERSYFFKYAEEYNKIIEKGENSYSIKNMDITFMYEIIKSKEIQLNRRIEDKLFRYLGTVVDDRNEYKHINYNEDEEELYLMGLLHLCHVRRFLKRLLINEQNIDQVIKDVFCKKYLKRVNDLKNILDEERIKIVEFTKQAVNNINNYLASDDKDNAWLEICEFYMGKPFNDIEDKMKELYKFSAMAYEVGIKNAKYCAMDYYLYEDKDYDKVEKLLIEDFNEGDKITLQKIDNLIYRLDYFKKHNIEKSNAFKMMISELKNKKFTSGKNEYRIIEIESDVLRIKKVK